MYLEELTAEYLCGSKNLDELTIDEMCQVVYSLLSISENIMNAVVKEEDNDHLNAIYECTLNDIECAKEGLIDE